MRSLVHFLPIATTVLAAVFTVILFRHWRRKPSALYLAWWTLGVAMYGVGTLTESLTTLFGWSELVFRSWYVSGALLGGAPLAQGTVYLLMDRKTAHQMTGALVAFIAVAATFVFMSPIDYAHVETYRLSGRVLDWGWVRFFSPFVNTYAAIFLIGGAAWSARKYWNASPDLRARAWGNILIAVGALLPGIGGSSARAGFVEVLYVTELVGLILIWLGYHKISRDSAVSIHRNQQTDDVAVDGTVELEPEPVSA